MEEWNKYEAVGNDFVPMERWGKDHWSTLVYLETCAVDARGMIENRRMRCNARLHRPFVGLMFDNEIQDGSKYPTRLTDNAELDNHDDWSCLEDMVKLGLIEVEWKVKDRRKAFGGCVARVKFTDKGLEVSSAIRRHKANGGQFATFRIEPV